MTCYLHISDFLSAHASDCPDWRKVHACFWAVCVIVLHHSLWVSLGYSPLWCVNNDGHCNFISNIFHSTVIVAWFKEQHHF